MMEKQGKKTNRKVRGEQRKIKKRRENERLSKERMKVE